MSNFWPYVPYIVVVLSAAMSVGYSIRYRRALTQRMRGVYNARMNICMGVMLISIAGVQIILFEPSTVRIIVGTLFLLLGLFNLFAGLRNHAVYMRMKDN